MRNIVLLLFFLCLILNVSAQNEAALAKSDSLYAKASEFYNNQKYPEAIKFCTEALNIREKIYGREHAECATLLAWIASYNSASGNPAEAIRNCKEALGIYEKVYGKEHLYCAMMLRNLASYNSSLGNYEEAIRLCTEALKVYDGLYGKDHSEYAKSLTDLASYNSAKGNYLEAVKFGTESLNIYERLNEKEYHDYATCLNNVAYYNGLIGNYPEALRLGEEALNIYERLYGKNHPDYAKSLNNIASYNSLIGNYTEAVRLGMEDLKIRERLHGKNHPDYAKSLNNIAVRLSKLGNYKEAIRFGTEALNIYEHHYGKEHSDYIEISSNLVQFNLDAGELAEAEKYCLSLYNIIKSSNVKSELKFADWYQLMAACENSRGYYQKAFDLERKASTIYKYYYGTDNLKYASSLHNLAKYNSKLGYRLDAKNLEYESLEIKLEILGGEHPDLIINLRNLLWYCYIAGDFYLVERYTPTANFLNAELIRKTFANLTASERQIYWNNNKDWFEYKVNQFAYLTCSPIVIENGYNATLLAKGILLNSERDFSELIAASGDEEVRKVFNELRITRNLLNRLYEKPIVERFADTDSLENVALLLERELLDRSKVYGDFTYNMTIDWKEVQKKLGSKDVAIEFVSFPTGHGRIRYAAYVLDSKMETPLMVALFTVDKLSEISPLVGYQANDLSKLIWGKLAEHIQNVENVYFAPAGELYNIAIESLPDPSGEGLISDRHKMYRLSSTRELAVIKDRNEIKRAALYGGLKYDTDVDVLEHDSERYATVNDREFSMANMTDSLNLRGGVSELPNTKIEVENISRSFKDTSIEPMLYTGNVGTEASFKALSGKKINIMHIATHGFYWTESEVRRSRNLGFLQIGDNSPRYVEDKALTRSGLLFTGANNVLTGKPVPDNVPDGVLTAKEISVLDLRGLDMVVLSACQTGLGEITGDGVFGLQRGFKKAGANTLLMSLWKVDDRATQMLMTKFYEHFLSGKTKLESLTLAQKYLREYEEDTDGEKIKPFEAPKYWAAFILLDAIN